MPWEKQFDRRDALQRAQRVFWKSGYERSSMSVLLRGMGIQKGSARPADVSPHPIRRSTNGLSVVSVNGAGHAILLVGDLENAELAELSEIVATPLARRLVSEGLTPSPDSGLRCRAGPCRV